MVVEVFFLPQVATSLSSKLCVVVDVLRATSTLVSMLEAGVSRVRLAGSVQDAIDLAASMNPRPLVCGERGGLAPVGFDRGNSPREFPAGSLAGKEIVHCTSNGTKAMGQLADSPVVFCGSLLNASAAVQAALAKAKEQSLDIALVCSGDLLGTRFAIDDAYCAGYLCTLLERYSSTPMPVGSRGAPIPEITKGSTVPVEVLAFNESALAAMRIYRSFVTEVGAPADIARAPMEATMLAFWESHNGQVLRQVGMSEDAEYCARVDVSDMVPWLYPDTDGLSIRGLRNTGR